MNCERGLNFISDAPDAMLLWVTRSVIVSVTYLNLILQKALNCCLVNNRYDRNSVILLDFYIITSEKVLWIEIIHSIKRQLYS